MPDYPDDLDHPLTRGDASLLGIGWRELAGPLWRSPYRGSHVWSATDPRLPLQRALDAACLLPEGGALGGWAAAKVAGVDELDGAPTGRPLPVPLCLPPRVTRRRGPTVVPWRSPLEAADVVEIGGVPVTRAVRTAFDLARHGDLEVAVASLDVLARGRPDSWPRWLRTQTPGPAGAGFPVPAAPWRWPARGRDRCGRPRSGCSGCWSVELPAPEVNAAVLGHGGWLLGMGDLLDAESGLLAEYDGAGHRDEVQHALDNAREEGFEDTGLVVVRFGNVDLVRHRTRAKQRLHAGYARARAAQQRDWLWRPGPLPPPVPDW